MSSNISIESESQTIESSICKNSRSNSVSSMSSDETYRNITDKNDDESEKQNSFSYDDKIENEMIRKKATQQLLWKNIRTLSIDSQEITPRYTIPLHNHSKRERDPPIRRDTPTINSIHSMLDMNTKEIHYQSFSHHK